MTKPRSRRKKPAGSGRPRLETEIPKILGKSKRGLLEKENLADATRAKLLSASRLLGLEGMSRLRKDELVDRLWRALQEAESPRTVEEAPHPTPEAKPTVAEHAPRSRAEFEAHKYSLTDEEPSSIAPREAPPKHIPWSYGRDRVRALPVDPERLYVYWEVTDEARERAKERLGAGVSAAWLNLRVYDTTGRLFDGTNAHSYFDHRVENGSRQWFFDIGKAGSEAFVEIGMKSHEGYFARIARAGRVIFPRRSPAPYREPQWLTVRASAGPSLITEPRASGALAPAAPRSARFAHVAAAGPAHVSPESPAPMEPPGPPEGSVVELREEREIQRRWEAPMETRVWEEGPFTLTVNVPAPVWEAYGGEATSFEVDGRTHLVFGPWQVVVRGLGAFEERRVISRWTIYRSWEVESGRETSLEAISRRTIGSSALLGGSERRFRGASELRLSGASELLYRGASERRLGGASERIYAAASERRYVAASEKLLRGGSERRLGGASGRR